MSQFSQAAIDNMSLAEKVRYDVPVSSEDLVDVLEQVERLERIESGLEEFHFDFDEPESLITQQMENVLSEARGNERDIVREKIAGDLYDIIGLFAGDYTKLDSVALVELLAGIETRLSELELEYK